MKEIFNIKRFWALMVKFYCENKKSHLIFIGGMAIVTFLSVCKFQPFHVEYTKLSANYSEAYFIADHEVKYAVTFWVLFGLFSIFAAGRVFQNVMSRSKAIGTLLLPASTCEKFSLAIVHSVVFVFLATLPLFYASAAISSSYKYVGLEKMDFQGEDMFGNQLPSPEAGQKVYAKVGNVLDRSFGMKFFTDVRSDNSQGVVGFPFFSLFLGIWSWLLGMFLWGSITFRKNSILLVILLHFLIGVLLFGGLWLGRDFVVDSIPVLLGRLLFLNTGVPAGFALSAWLLLLYLFPIAYFVVTWRKFRNKQV